MPKVSLIRLIGAGHHALLPFQTFCCSFSHRRFVVAVHSAIIDIKYSFPKCLGIVAVPLSIDYDKTTGLTADETNNKQRLDDATTLGKSCSSYTMDMFVMTNIHIVADAQIKKMREGFDKYQNGDANAKTYFEAAFGQDGTNVKADKVNDVITKLENGQVKAEVGTASFTDKIASTPWTKKDLKTDGVNTPWTPGNVQFSAQFHGILNLM